MKNRANTLAAILGNMEDLEGAYKSALNAEGSALKENETYLDSIQGRIDLFKNSVQTMWMNFIDSDVVKFLVDIGTALVNFIDKFGLLGTLAGTLLPIKTVIGDIKKSFEEINSGKVQTLEIFKTKNMKEAAEAAKKVAEEQDNAAKSAQNLSSAQKGAEAATKGSTEATKKKVKVKQKHIATEHTETAAVKGGTAATWLDTAATKANEIATKSLAIAKSVIKGVLIGLAVTAVTNVVTSIINSAKEAAERMRELTDEAITSAQEINNTRDSVEEYKSEIESLRATLADNNTTEQEAYDARAQLIEIQNQLIDKFGKEAEGINLVTGAIQDQIAAIDSLSQKESVNWMTENSEAYNNAIKEMQKTYDFKDFTISSFIDGQGSLSSLSEDVLNAYNEGIRKIVEDAGGVVESWSTTNTNDYITQTIEKTRASFEDKTVEEIDSVLSSLGEFLIKFGHDNGVDLTEQLNQIEDIKKQYVDEDYKKARELYNEGRQQEAIAEYATQYGDILDAEEKFYKSTTDKDRLDAIVAYSEAIAAAEKEATEAGDTHMVDYFSEMSDKFAEQEFEIRVKLSKDDEDGLQSHLEEIIQKGGENGLSALDDNQIKELAKAYNNGSFSKTSAGYYTDDKGLGYNSSQIEGIAELQKQADAAGISIETLISILTNLGLISGRPVEEMAESVKNVGQSYSTLATSVEKYASINNVLNESMADNIELSQEQYDALNELIGSEEDFSDCIDKSNGYIVKNAALLRKLVDQKKQEQKATIKEAKAYNQLQYKTTVGQIRKLISSMESEVRATGYVSSATLENINVLQEQLGAIKQTIQQYSLLELKLSDAASAYSEFEAAKARDAELTYGSSMIEMLQVINDGFKTGQVGSEAFQAAVKALVPESVYKDIDNLQERMQKIHDYIDGDSIFADYFTIDDSGNFSITMDNIKNFIQDGLKDGVGAEFGVFEGSLDDFDLSDQITSIKDLADAYGITEAAALAMLTEFEKYDASWSDIIADLTTTPLDRNINDATDALDEALEKQKDFILSGEPLYDENGKMTAGYKAVTDAVNDAQSALDKATQEAADNAQTYVQVESILKGMSGEVKYTQEEANALARSLGLVNENGECVITISDDGKLQLTQSQVEELNKRLTGLEEPTILDIQLAYDEISEKIQGLTNRTPEILVEFGLTNASDKEVQDKIDELTTDKEAIELMYNITTTSTAQASSNMEKLTEWETNGVNIVIKGDTSSLQTAVEEANALETEDKETNINGNPEDALADIALVNQEVVADKKPGIYMQGVSAAISDINSIGDAIENLPDSARVTVSVGYNGDGVADGNFHISGGAFAGGAVGAPKTETALVGELGPEMLVRNGRWTTVGDNGAEFTQVKKGDIIFNHKQTEQLLKNGHVTGRGKAYASGTAYKFGIFDTYEKSDNVFKNSSKDYSDPSNNLSKAADKVSDAADELREVFDWIEVRLEEINDDLSLKNAKLENTVGHKAQNKAIDEIIDINQKLYDNLIAGANRYYTYAEKLLAKVPSAYRDAAQNGTIALEEFVGEVDEKTLEAIQNYREWVQKGDDLTVQAEETLTEITNLAKQAIDNIASDYENKKSLSQNKIDQYEAYNSLLETTEGFESAAIYQQMIAENNNIIKNLEEQRNKMQEELDKRVESGEIEKYSQAWYDAVNDIAAVDTEIIELKTDTENWQDAINELHWDKFDALISRLESASEEAANLIDILSNEDMVDESGNWTDEGITALGLYVQQMEAAEVQARKYQEEIDYLNENWQALGYTEQEYLEKLDELKDGQYDAIKAYHDSKDAIVDLNKERIDAIKEGIEKEIEAYEELIKTKQEELDSEKDLYDFQKSIADKQKNISDIERKLAALAGDNSASARAKRAQLEADLAEARAELEEAYYERSIQDQQDALDKELENFQEEKDAEMEGWDEYLENTEQVVADSLATVQANTETVYQTLLAMGEEYGLSITESITSPWIEGENAIQSFSEQFGIAMSATVEELQRLELEFKETMSAIEQAGADAANSVRESAQGYTEAEYHAPTGSGGSGGSSTAGLVSSIPGYIQYGHTGANVKKLQRALNELGYGNSGTSGLDGIFGYKTLDAVKQFQKAMGIKDDGIVGEETKKKFKAKGYATGSTGIDEDQWALIDELGEELVIRPQNGRLAFMTKGTGVVPADLTANLMEWGAIDPSGMLERSRPQIGVSPSVSNNTMEMRVDASVGELIHVEHLDGNNPAEIAKIVDKAWDKRMKELNANIRRYTNR